jgi:hypothetical protein
MTILASPSAFGLTSTNSFVGFSHIAWCSAIDPDLRPKPDGPAIEEPAAALLCEFLDVKEAFAGLSA